MTAPIMSRFDLFFILVDEPNEQNDYNIARHLLNVHRYRDSPVEAEFTSEQIQRYIRFARTVKPKLTPEAGELLVQKYKLLRAGDATGQGTSYRITVRQLESLIRLSEALARLHLDGEIKEAYVEEACRLLKSSILRVEQDNVDVTMSASAFDAAAEKVARAAVSDSVNGSESSARFQLKYEEYVRITNMLVYHLKRTEAADSSEDSDMSSGGTRKSELIDWFLEQIEDEIATEADLEIRRLQLGGVIDRLVEKDHVLLAIKAGGMQTDGIASEDPYLVVHPNYVL